jgi:hypothetical protein
MGDAMEGLVAFSPEAEEPCPELLDDFGAPRVTREFVGVELLAVDVVVLNTCPFLRESAKQQVLPTDVALGVNNQLFIGVEGGVCKVTGIACSECTKGTKEKEFEAGMGFQPIETSGKELSLSGTP